MNKTFSSPTDGDIIYNITTSSSSIPNVVKELIVTYYRNNMTETQITALAFAIWYFTGDWDNGVGYNAHAEKMIKSLKDKEIGDIYTFTDDNLVEHTFNFFYGTPFWERYTGNDIKTQIDSTYQKIILFNYGSSSLEDNGTGEDRIRLLIRRIMVRGIQKIMQL